MHAIINGRRQLNDIEWDQQRKKNSRTKMKVTITIIYLCLDCLCVGMRETKIN